MIKSRKFNDKWVQPEMVYQTSVFIGKELDRKLKTEQHYLLWISGNNNTELLVFRTEPTTEIRFKGQIISMEKFIEILEKIEYNGE